MPESTGSEATHPTPEKIQNIRENGRRELLDRLRRKNDEGFVKPTNILKDAYRSRELGYLTDSDLESLADLFHGDVITYALSVNSVDQNLSLYSTQERAERLKAAIQTSSDEVLHLAEKKLEEQLRELKGKRSLIQPESREVGVISEVLELIDIKLGYKHKESQLQKALRELNTYLQKQNMRF